MVSPGDTVGVVTDFCVVVCPFGIKCTLDGIEVGELDLLGGRVGNDDQALAVVEIVGAAVETGTIPPIDGCRGAGNAGNSSRCLGRDGRAGKSSLIFGGLVDRVIVATDSKSWSG